MGITADELPDDPDALKAKVLAREVENARLRQIIKELQRHRFGRRAESLSDDQLLLGLEEAEQIEATGEEEAEHADPAKRAAGSAKRRTNRGSLPAHLPRVEMVVDIEDHTCPCCRNGLHRFIGRSTTNGAVRLSHLRPAMKVWVFQWPNGALERSRWPFGHRRRRRVILVVVPVSSINTRRFGSSRILGWRFATHSWRAAGLAIIYLFPLLTKAIPSPLVAIAILTIVTVYGGIDVNTVGEMGKLPTSLPVLALVHVPFTFQTLRIILSLFADHGRGRTSGDDADGADRRRFHR